MKDYPLWTVESTSWNVRFMFNLQANWAVSTIENCCSYASNWLQKRYSESQLYMYDELQQRFNDVIGDIQEHLNGIMKARQEKEREKLFLWRLL